MREREEGWLASLLSDLTRMSLPLEMDAGNWERALFACYVMVASVPVILRALDGRGFLAVRIALWKLLFIEVPGIAEASAYAAHRAGLPFKALMPLESLTGIFFDQRRLLSVARHVEGSWATRPDAGADLRKAASRQVEASAAALQGETPATARQQGEEAIMAALSLPGLPDPVEQYLITAANWHAVRAARLTGRTVLYVVPGYGIHEGVAIRVNQDRSGRHLVESVLLPGLTAAAVQSRAEAARAAFRQQGSDSPDGDARTLRQFTLGFLDWSGATVWEPVLAAWPDLESGRVAAIPIGRAALLPLYTAMVGGDPACTRMDLTIAPSARVLHYAAIQPAADLRSRPLVAADRWGSPGDPGYLPKADCEARAIAAIYGTTPILCDTDTAKILGRHHPVRTLVGRQASSLTPKSAEIATRMREATVMHLCCHGVVNEGKIDLALLLGGIMLPAHFLESGKRSQHGERRELRGHPLVVLSACELGGFLSTGMVDEQYGLAAAFMAIGARAVVGSLWTVPDSTTTIRLMEDFHRRLTDLPPSAALSATIAQARRNQTPPAFWGGLTHYGI
jgi:hypothetical protein